MNGPYNLTTRKTAKDRILGHWYWRFKKGGFELKIWGISGFLDPKNTFINHEKAKYWSKKNYPITPDMVALKSGKIMWFNCPCGPRHDFQSVVRHITNGHWCPYCRPGARRLCKCEICFKKSMASHPTSKYWSTKNELEPWQVTLQSSLKIWFDCPTCAHTFDCTPAHITNEKRWCPYCSNQKLCENNKCEFCYNNSFASYTLCENIIWSKKNPDTPRQNFKSSSKKRLFNCLICEHDFESALHNISSNRGSGCPYCSHRKLCENSECKFCFNNSFASYKGNILWSNRNEEQNTRKIFIHSGKYASFFSNCGHYWEARISSITGQGTGCPICKNKTEKKLLEWLQKQSFIKQVKHQYKPKWCSTEYREFVQRAHPKSKRYQYSYDFLVTLQNGKQLIIELDGRQHFEQVSNWEGPLHNQIRDAYKERKARQHKLKVIRILQEDVYYDRNDWEETLTHKLKSFQ